MKNISKKNWVLYIVTFLVVVIGDQLTKILVSSSMMLGQSQAIIDNFFYYTYSFRLLQQFLCFITLVRQPKLKD